VITLGTLTDGLLGAVVGGVAVFGATAFAVWRTRIGDSRRERARRYELDSDTRKRYAAEVIATLRELEREVRSAPFLAAHSQAAFLRVVMLFYLAEKAEHPLVAKWLLAQHGVFQQMGAPSRVGPGPGS